MSDGADASGAAAQHMPAPWAMRGLHNAAYRERCAATLADTLVKDDEDGRWLFTSKRGEIQRKKKTSAAEQAKMITERFVRLGLMGDGNAEGFVCCVRKSDGGFKFLGENAFAKLGGALPAEPDVVGLQAYVHGNYYRNAYERADGAGRIKTATVVIPTRPDDSQFSQHGADGPKYADGPDGEVGITVPGRKLRSYGKSRATKLNETLDAATQSLVRFLEKTQRCRVAKLSADYVVDARNQLWLVWLGDCTSVQVHVSTASRPTDGATAPSQVDDIAIEQVQDATARVDTVSRGERRRKRDMLRQGGPPAWESDEDDRWGVKFTPTSPAGPRNQRCRGDYCGVQIHDPKQLFTDAEMRAFTGSDVDALRSLVRDTYSEGPTTEIAFRSIYLAGQEKRGFKAGQERKNDEDLPDWMKFPEDPADAALRDALDEAHAGDVAEDDDEPYVARVSESAQDVERRRANRLNNLGNGSTFSADTDASRARRDWRAQRGEPEGGAAAMYRPCRVCAHCASMYALLDKGREILDKDSAQDKQDASKIQREERRALVQFAEEPSQTMDAATGFRDALSHRIAGAPVDQPPPVVSESTVKRPPPVAAHKSWKGRLPEAELYGADAPASQIERNQNERFEKLDEYLRGTSDAAARKAEQRQAALARSRAAQLKIAKEEQLESSDLYFGRVLVVEARGSSDLPDCVRALESAGFVVDVELDVQHAREMLVAAHGADAAPGWQYDAILVSDVLDLGDAFDVVGEVRQLEKARRKRASAEQVAKAKRAAAKPGGFDQDDERLKPGTFIHLPVVVLSARTAPEDLRAYKTAGLDGCISRPLQKAALLSTLRAAVPRHGRQLLGNLSHPKKGSQSTGGEPARDRGSASAFVSWTVRLTGLTPDDFDVGVRNAFCAEAATQLGVVTERLELVEVTSGSAVLHLRATGFESDDAARAFARALRARSQLVDEENWGRHALDRIEITVSTGQVEGVLEKRSGARAEASTGGNTGSSALAAKSLSLPASFTAVDGSVGGVLQLDADTSLPYVVVDFSLASNGSRPSNNEPQAAFNLVVCHDFFDTFERLKIVLTPIAARYPGLQVLLWNYPGQAFTEWREEQLLNNTFLASCLSELITHAGNRGTRQFDDQKPFFLLGYGYGASVASFYATHYRQPAMRGLVLCNGFSFVDPHLAGALHDAMNVFSCAPPSRPDLPVYFWSRFLFSRDYLTKVSTPLALNLYTAVHNPITPEGRMQLCVGALGSHDVRPALSLLDLPCICVHSTEGILVKPSHAQAWTDPEQGRDACATIHQALKTRKTCVVWVKAGHELFQESRKQVSVLLEQLLVGYHEVNDVSFVTADFADGPAAVDRADSELRSAAVRTPQVGHTPLATDLARESVGHGNFEDEFIDSVLGKVRDSKIGHNAAHGDPDWVHFSNLSAERADAALGRMTKEDPLTTVARKRKDDMVKTVLDPRNPAFERQDNVVYKPGEGSHIYPNPQEYPEVKEYMAWRLKRNKKRLQRLEFAAKTIQAAFRNHLTWAVVRRLREERAASSIQRAYRGWRGRQAFLVKMRQIWAAHVIQRAWRGFSGRGFFTLLKTMHAAGAQMQRCARGLLARLLVQGMQKRRHRAATMLQTLWRQVTARYATFELRNRSYAARAVERCYRGHLGRRRAQNERHKFLFSKSQSQGIEFGRQMLLEHKLHATRLQSEVSLLTQEKVSAEESVEALLEEISEFEQGVAQLEKEMHQLSKIEAEAVGVLDEEAKYELREQKMRLDREFGTMLAKIAERREKLGGLEGKHGDCVESNQ